jgi:putative membrane protein
MYAFNYWHDYCWPLGSFFNIIILVLIVFLVISLCKHSGPSESKPDEAMDLLRKRYAAGEISKDEFEQKKKDLGG